MNEICQKIKRKENGSTWKLKKQFKGHLKQNASNGTGCGELTCGDQSKKCIINNINRHCHTEKKKRTF